MESQAIPGSFSWLVKVDSNALDVFIPSLLFSWSLNSFQVTSLHSQLIAMAQTLAPAQKSIASQGDRKILCLHINTTREIQLIRITDIPNLHLERVVFPGQRLMFEAVPEANLDIQTSEAVTSFVSCQQLRV